MDLSNTQISNNVLIHPSLRQRLAELDLSQSYVVELQNYALIANTFGAEVAQKSLAALVLRVERALGTSGVAIPEGETGIRVFRWGAPKSDVDPVDRDDSGFLEALMRDIALEPVFTAAGPVHLQAAVTNLHRGGCDGANAVGRDVVGPSAVRVSERTYCADMAVLSPVLAAIGGFRDAQPVGSTSNVVDVDIAWRPVGRSMALGKPAFHEASLTLIRADGQLTSCEHVMAAAERVGLVHLLDEYVVSRAADELVEAPGAVSLLVAVSAKSLSDRQFWRGILEKLECGVGLACDLIVEVRGGASAGAPTGMSETIAMIRQQGCRLSFGNFGLGSTSFRDLIAFNPDFVTIDRYFLSQTSRTQLDGQPLTHLVGLAHALGAEVIIDGVDCIELATVARESGAALQKGAWCGNPRFFRSWAKKPMPFVCDEQSGPSMEVQ